MYYLILAFLFFLTFYEPFNLVKVPVVKKVNKVLFTCDSMGSGGAEKVLSIIANEMSSYGIQVSIIGVGDTQAPSSFYSLNKSVIYDNLRVKDGKKVNPIKKIILLRRKIRTLSPDVVISFLPNANVYTWVSIIGTGIPHIVSERNNPYIDPREKVLRLLKKASFYFADGCTFQTNDAMEFYKNKIHGKCTIIKNPIILNCAPSENVIPKTKIVLAVGRLTKQKNYICLLEAFKKFNSKQRDSYTLKIYGDGVLKGNLVKYSETIGIKDKVVFMGTNNNWHKIEKEDSMYILSSDYEGMPNALAEAMALGIPSISTDCPTGGSKELIIDGVNGYLVPVNNSEALFNKMMLLVSEKNDFYLNTRNLIGDYSAKNITNQWIKFIKSLNREVYE